MIPTQKHPFQNVPKIYYDLSTIKWMRNKVKPEVISKSIDNLLIQKENEEGVLIKLIKYSSRNKLEKCQSLQDIINKKIRLGYNPALFFQKDSLDKIFKLRNLFSIYDDNSERKLTINKLNKLFNLNHSKSLQKELKCLFSKLNINNKSNEIKKEEEEKVSLNDLVNFSLNDKSKQKYLSLLKKINDNTSHSIETNNSHYLPLDFERALLYYHDYNRTQNSIHRIKNEIQQIENAQRNNNGKETEYKDNIRFDTTGRQVRRILKISKKHIDSIDDLPIIKEGLKRNPVKKEKSCSKINEFLLKNDNIKAEALLKRACFYNKNNKQSQSNIRNRNRIMFKSCYKSKSLNSTNLSASVL